MPDEEFNRAEKAYLDNRSSLLDQEELDQMYREWRTAYIKMWKEQKDLIDTQSKAREEAIKTRLSKTPVQEPASPE